ncbi:MAG: hypothetical protein ACRC1K_23500 [Planctomycetia bacterium]
MTVSHTDAVNHIDPSGNARMAAVGEELRRLQEELRRQRHEIRDVFTPMGQHAPFLRAAFASISLPINTIDEMLERLGGPDRVISAPGMDGASIIVSAADFVDGLRPFLTELLPIRSWADTSRRIAAMVRKVGKHEPLLKRLRSEHLKAILADPERRERAFPNQPHRQFRQMFLSRLEIRLSKIRNARAMDVHPGFLSLEDFVKITKGWLETHLDIIQANIVTAKIVAAKTASAMTLMTQADAQFNAAETHFEIVLLAQALTNSVRTHNAQGEAAYDAAVELVFLAAADVNAAAAAAQQIPDNAQAQTAVAQAQAKLQILVQRLQVILDKLGQTEDHKDLIAIPIIAITVSCFEEDSCNDNDPVANVSVSITNLDNTNIQQTGQTNSGGFLTLQGRFGNSRVLVVAESSSEEETLQNTFSTGTQSTQTSFLFDT